MSHRKSNSGARARGAVPLSELVGRLVSPLTAARSFAKSDLSAVWTEIVGERFASFSRPEKLVWPKGPDTEGRPALLLIRVHGPRAIYLQHEAGQIIERANAFLGYRAIDRIKLTQGTVDGDAKPPDRKPPTVSAESAAQLTKSVEGVEDDRLKAALEKLGRGVMASSAIKTNQSP